MKSQQTKVRDNEEKVRGNKDKSKGQDVSDYDEKRMDDCCPIVFLHNSMN